ncbi:MADS-box protein AGL24-like isoform X7 [Malus domestica]|uniref:MADS-box protein AGL24-like isoform X7 n=1 Tax=Malus domestica TaxID=3750 RepID=UPI00397471FC
MLLRIWGFCLQPSDPYLFKEELENMMREKIKIRKIDYLPARQVTFSKRRSGDLKKAGEMLILCESEAVVIIFSQVGKLLDFSSSKYGFYGRRLESSNFYLHV